MLWKKSGGTVGVGRGAALLHREAARTVSIQRFLSEVVETFLSTYSSAVIVSHKSSEGSRIQTFCHSLCGHAASWNAWFRRTKIRF